jgi:hypothetical protein
MSFLFDFESTSLPRKVIIGDEGDKNLHSVHTGTCQAHFDRHRIKRFNIAFDIQLILTHMFPLGIAKTRYKPAFLTSHDRFCLVYTLVKFCMENRLLYYLI